MPTQFWPILQENRSLLHGMPAMGAESIKLWAKARHGVRVILMIVQHTFGGLLNFYPHLHVLVSVGGLREAEGRWISRLKYGQTGPSGVDGIVGGCCDHLSWRGPEKAGDRAGTLRTRATNAPRRAVRARLVRLRYLNVSKTHSWNM